MKRCLVGVAVVCVSLCAAGPAGAGAYAEVFGGDGTLLSHPGGSSYVYPADGSGVRIASAVARPGSIVLKNVSILGGRVQVARLVVPRHGVAGAQIDGLTIDGKAGPTKPNTIVPLGQSSYLVVLQQAVTPGTDGRNLGLVGLRVYIDDSSSGIAPGTQLLIGLARAAPAGDGKRVDASSAVMGFDHPFVPPVGLSGTGILEPLPMLALDGSLGSQAVLIAERYLGIPYVWGGASPQTGFDCSGLVTFVYAQLGISLIHYSGAQYHEGRPVSIDQLRPGDLVFFHPGPTGPGHVGIYIGGGQFIQAPHTGDVVKISNLFAPQYLRGYVGAVRPY
jgi:hypothetical protein